MHIGSCTRFVGNLLTWPRRKKKKKGSSNRNRNMLTWFLLTRLSKPVYTAWQDPASLRMNELRVHQFPPELPYFVQPKTHISRIIWCMIRYKILHITLKYVNRLNMNINTSHWSSMTRVVVHCYIPPVKAHEEYDESSCSALCLVYSIIDSVVLN